MKIVKITVTNGFVPRRDDAREIIMDAFFHLPRPVDPSCGKWIPSIDLYETENEMILVVEAAGITPETLAVVIDGRHLSVSGTRSIPGGEERKLFHRIEIEYGRFERQVALPWAPDPEHMSARYENGLLVVKIGKKSPPSSRSISIETVE
ncbi:MAG: Hsp20/alpha crystallin family protein [Deltaproteobacteria bacterium]